MNSRLHIFAGLLMVMLIATISCSGVSGNGDIPTSPDLTREVEIAEAGHYLWAYYSIYVDPELNSFEVVPLRQVTEHWNVLKFLEQGPCTNCVDVVNVVPTGNGTKNWTVNIIHPFPTLNFTGFDVRGIAMFAGSHTFPVAGLTTSDRYTGDGELVNADGYTALYNGTTAGSGPGGLQGYIKGKYTPAITPNSLLNGYKRHISPGASDRNEFIAGSTIGQVYELDMPDLQFVFGYAIDASWAPPTTTPVTDPVNDFPPEANCQEPWNLDITEESIGQGLTDQGGQTKLYIDVYDHQGKNSHFAPIIECSDLFPGIAMGVFVEDGTGYTRYEATVENSSLAEDGEYKCLVSVEDTTNATSPDYLDLTAYQVVNLTVAPWVQPENQPPVAAAHAEPANPLANQQVNFYDDSTDPDGADDITKWEWDFSYDIIEGFNPGTEVQNPIVQFPDPGTYQVMLRVTDTIAHSDMLDLPLIINVQGSNNYPPSACADADNTQPSADEWVHFFDCSSDPDGYPDIVMFDWDMDGDGEYGDKFGPSPMWKYDEGGDYLVQHKVTDTASNWDELNEPLLIEVNAPPIAAAEASSYSLQMGDVVTLTNLSYDDDGNGDIEEVYWDINGDDDYDDPEDIEGQDEVQLQFYEGGTHYIGLMVVDEWGLEAELDPPLEIYVEPFDPFCVNLIDQYNSADSLYGTRTFRYFQGAISELEIDYDAPNGPWDFSTVPPAQPAICQWFTPAGLDDPTPAGIWPNADFFFKESAPVAGGSIYAPHRFDFVDAENGDLVLQGQWQTTQTLDYNEVFGITHPICHPWADGDAGSGTVAGVDVDITWTMESLGTGPAIFTVDGSPIILNCMLIRHNIHMVDTLYGILNFSLLNYQWIDSDGNEVAFMEATNGLEGTNFSGNTYTGEVICRAQIAIS